MLRLVRAFAADCRGATAIEYSLIAGSIACAIAALIVTIGASVNQMWTLVLDAFR